MCFISQQNQSKAPHLTNPSVFISFLNYKSVVSGPVSSLIARVRSLLIRLCESPSPQCPASERCSGRSLCVKGYRKRAGSGIGRGFSGPSMRSCGTHSRTRSDLRSLAEQWLRCLGSVLAVETCGGLDKPPGPCEGSRTTLIPITPG